MPSWSDEDYFSTGLYFPLAPLHLHVMLVGCGFEKRTEHAYDWNGLRRGESPMCIFQCTVDGEGELMIGGGCRRLRMGDAMLLSVPEDHRYRLPPDSAFWKHVYVNLSGSEAMRIWEELRRKFGPVVHLPVGRSKSLDSAFVIVSAAKNRRIRDALHASSLAYGFLMTLFEELTLQDIAESEASFVLEAVRFCMEHYAEDITVADIAEAAGYSRCHFSRMFTRIHGTSPGEFLRELRLGHAARILQMENCSVKEVASRCGFSDGSYFCRAFRLRYGVSPDLYRKNR